MMLVQTMKLLLEQGSCVVVTEKVPGPIAAELAALAKRYGGHVTFQRPLLNPVPTATAGGSHVTFVQGAVSSETA